MASVALRSISKSFDTTQVLSNIDLEIADGEFVTLVGASGCGKSTLIRIIAGLEPQSAGSVEVGGRAIDHLRPHERRVAMVFQSYALYPHMSVAANIALPLSMQRLSLWERLPLVKHLSPRRRSVTRGIAKEVDAVAAQLQIGALLARRPSQLSGGQRQRVALGRAMVRHPDVFLMDEPLSNLDAKLRVHMRSELAELHARLGATFVYVTHDQVEAMTMSDRVAMMDAGRILQLGTPSELYARPANLKVAQFIGSPAINVLPGQVDSGGRIVVAGAALPVDASLPAGSAVSVGLRPESITPLPAGHRPPRDAVSIGARLRRVENLGAEYIMHCDVDGLDGTVVTCRVSAESAPPGDGALLLAFSPFACHVFDAAGERIRVVDDASRREAVRIPGATAVPNPTR
ncbi:MAG TPA: ABC transporter ATP-binding protein [Casimicrobiaceae bacterium]|nr:ABC transporter ATP-binding protein [Casimicrobiaceae bacterium]